jgi:arabinose-5-phosphate isomerase
MSDMTLGPSAAGAVLAFARGVIAQESANLSNLAASLDLSFEAAVSLILQSSGRVGVIGVGKSGIVGHKIAASLASLGTPAYFIHGVEALHGDLGMVAPGDIVVLLSHSGRTREVLDVLFHLQGMDCTLIAITGAPESPLAQATAIHLDTGVRHEADPRELAPTTSAIATMALGDALALTLAERRGFTREMFGRLHPGGALGERLSESRLPAHSHQTEDGVVS